MKRLYCSAILPISQLLALFSQPLALFSQPLGLRFYSLGLADISFFLERFFLFFAIKSISFQTISYLCRAICP